MRSDKLLAHPGSHVAVLKHFGGTLEALRYFEAESKRAVDFEAESKRAVGTLQRSGGFECPLSQGQGFGAVGSGQSNG